MKRKRAADGSSPPCSPPKNINLLKKSRPNKIAHSSPLGTMDLPTELKQKILFSLTPKERCNLRLVNKAMLDAVDTSMSDVQKIKIDYGRNTKIYPSVDIWTINPYNDTKETYSHKTVSSSLPFLLKWTGAQLKTLKLTTCNYTSEDDNSHVMSMYQVLQALNSENTCPKLKNLSLRIGQSLWDNNEILHSELLKYVTKRQAQAKAVDSPTPFLHSLSFISKCYPIRSKSFGVELLHRFLFFIDFRSPEKKNIIVYREKRRKFLQDLLDQCHGLKELDVDGLLVDKDLPIVAPRYPTTLIHLKTVRLGKTPGDLTAITDNCPNLQIVNLDAGFTHDDANLCALLSLSDLRELTFESTLPEEESVRIFPQCFAAFKDYPFGASVARLWPQFKSVTLNCYKDEKYEDLNYRLLLSGANCSIISLHLTGFNCYNRLVFFETVQQLLKALNSEDACPNLMELSIDSCELVNRIKDSLAATKDREPEALQWWLKEIGDASLPIPESQVYDMLNELLTYVTKRQSEVRLGKPFLRSLSIGIGDCECCDCEGAFDDLDDLRDLLEEIHTTLQQIFDQCHGLEELFMESLTDEWVNPDQKKGKELLDVVPLRFPRTLKKLNGVWLDSMLNN